MRRRERDNRDTECFGIVTKEEENKWIIPNKKIHIPGGDIEEKLSAETLVPANLDKGKEVDDFIVSILKRTNQCIASHINLKMFQKKRLNIMRWVHLQFPGKE